MSRCDPASIVVIAGDAGGAAAVAPVVDVLRRRGRVTVHLFGYRHALEMWTRRGWNVNAADENMTEAAAAHVLAQAKAAALLTGTSLNEAMVETRFISAAHRMEIPSLAVVDSWLNYRERFAFNGPGCTTIPARIAVMDARASAEMIAAGFDPATVVVTGQPAFDELRARRSRFDDASREAIRAQWRVARGHRCALFVSQPLSQFYGSDAAHDGFLGYDERSVLAALVDAFTELGRRRPDDAPRLVVRPHPREDPSWMHPIVERYPYAAVHAGGDPLDAALSADLVAGMNSILLVQACILGQVVVSIQPGLRSRDALPTNATGSSLPLYDARELVPTLERLLFDAAARDHARRAAQLFQPEPDASERVANLIVDLIGRDEPVCT